MKQPKFRGFCSKTNEWHYGHGWFEVDYTEKYKQEKGIIDKAMLYTEGYPIECELISMGRYADLKDKNGKEVYEGDIVQGHTFDEDINKKQIGSIEYSEERHGFIFVPFDLKSKNLYYPLFAIVTCEVVGTIYENENQIKK